MIIDRFKDGYSFLSNFHPCKVWYENVLYYSSEAAYQTAKSTDDDEREDIRCAPSPGAAKRLGKPGVLKHFRPDWDNVKVGIMEAIVRAKFEDPELRKMLLDTKDYTLIEGNTWHDNFWGDCMCNRPDKPKCRAKGENNLGKVLMKIREEIRNAQKATDENTRPD